MKYRIRDWQKHYENNKSRERTELKWCPFPNKQTGIGLIRIMAHENGEAIYGCFVAVVLMLSRQKKPHRDGWLTIDGKPDSPALEVEDIAAVTRFKPTTITQMLELLSSDRIAWIETHPEIPVLPKRRKPRKAGKKVDVTVEQVEAIYKMYPRKVKKQNGLRAIRVALQDGLVSYARLHSRVEKYASCVSQWPKEDQKQYVSVPGVMV